jgi:glucose-6-phosphate 1-dehydrogenase
LEQKVDLTRRKLIPALYNLYIEGHLPTFAICCIDYLETDQAEFKADLLAGINEFSRNGTADSKQWNEFSNQVTYLKGDFNDASTFTTLKKMASDFDKRCSQRSIRIFYLATAPRFYRNYR